MSKPTPGPWAVNPVSKCVYAVNKPQDQPAVAAVQDSKDPLHRGFAWVDREIEREANARLIAAAPDLLEALNRIHNWLVCAAIATPEDMAQSFEEMEQVARAAILKATTEEGKG